MLNKFNLNNKPKWLGLNDSKVWMDYKSYQAERKFIIVSNETFYREMANAIFNIGKLRNNVGYKYKFDPIVENRYIKESILSNLI